MVSHLLDSAVLYQVITIICQTFFYGIYFCLFPISIYVMVTKGLQARSRKWLFDMTITMFASSSMYWVLSVVLTFVYIDFLESQFGPVPRIPRWLLMINSLLLVNYIFTDGVVVWRAWVLCSDQKRAVLMFPVIMLGINTQASRVGSHCDYILGFAQVAYMALSLLTNIFATSLIAVKAWKYRKTLMTSGVGIQTPTRGIRILALVVESGMLYIFIGVGALVSPFIDPIMTVMFSNIFFSSAFQLAGMYPIVVLLLVETNRSLDTTYFSSSPIIDVRGVNVHEWNP